MRSKSLLLGMPLAAALLLSGCGAVRIGRVIGDPYRYNNRNVKVEGVVTRSFGVMGVGGYQVTDGTGKIFVIANRGVPAPGARVSVKGTVNSGVVVMGKSYGTAIRESDHKVRY